MESYQIKSFDITFSKGSKTLGLLFGEFKKTIKHWSIGYQYPNKCIKLFLNVSVWLTTFPTLLCYKLSQKTIY